MSTLIIKLLIAHLIGDFLFQPNKWVKDKENRKEKSPYLYYHILVHTVALLILLQFQLGYWFGISIILISHFIIDLIKLHLNSTINSRVLFFLDQIAHLLIIAIVVYHYTPYTLDFTLMYSSKSLLFVLFFLLTTVVSSILMKVIICKWGLEENDEANSLKMAGKYIGILERAFIFMFIVNNHWEGIGFLLASKSIFRFGDLSKAKDRELTEYIMIGTLLSFGLSITFSIAYEYFFKLLN